MHRGRITWNEAMKYADRPKDLFHGTESSGKGTNDRIPVNIADQQNSSLRLIHVPEIKIGLVPDSNRDKPQTRIGFHYPNGEDHPWYWLKVTDTEIEDKFVGSRINVPQEFGEALVCVRLSEPYPPGGATKKHRYLLAAAIVLKEER